jgi:hypothetical protein
MTSKQPARTIASVVCRSIGGALQRLGRAVSAAAPRQPRRIANQDWRTQASTHSKGWRPIPRRPRGFALSFASIVEDSPSRDARSRPAPEPKPRPSLFQPRSPRA